MDLTTALVAVRRSTTMFLLACLLLPPRLPLSLLVAAILQALKSPSAGTHQPLTVLPQSPATRLPSLTASMAITRSIPVTTAVKSIHSATNNHVLLLSLCSSKAPITSKLAPKSGQRSLLSIAKAQLLIPAAVLLLTMDPKVSLK